MIRKVSRRGERRLLIDLCYTKNDGTKARLRRDAAVQTMEAARAEERRLLTNIATHGDPFGPPTAAAPAPAPEASREVVTFAAAVTAYQTGTAIAQLKPSTRKGYEEVFRTRLLPRWGDTPIDRIDLVAMTKLDAEMVTEGLSISRRRNVLICMRSTLRDAHASKKLDALPSFPSLPKKGRKVLAVITAEALHKILDVSPPEWRLAFALAAYAGLRAGEVRALRWRDVDLEGRLLVVRLSRSKGETATPKSGHERPVPLAAALHDLLKRLAGQRQGHRDNLVALTSRGKPWGEFGLLQAWHKAQEKAGLSGWRFHDLRHYFVTSLLNGGGSAPAVQALAGHLHLSTTQLYAHVVGGDLRATISVLDGQGHSKATLN